MPASRAARTFRAQSAVYSSGVRPLALRYRLGKSMDVPTLLPNMSAIIWFHWWLYPIMFDCRLCCTCLPLAAAALWISS